MDLIRGSPYRLAAAEGRIQGRYRRPHSITIPHGQKPLALRAATTEFLTLNPLQKSFPHSWPGFDIRLRGAGGRCCNLPPTPGSPAGEVEALEKRLDEQLVPHSPVEGFHAAVLHRLAGGDVVPLDLAISRSCARPRAKPSRQSVAPPNYTCFAGA